MNSTTLTPETRSAGVGPLPLVATAVIFSVSLFASSFPTLSNRISYIRIPPIVFFIGKHFGTGVILSTAFVHLLQDAFESLLDPAVKRISPYIGEWVGLIVLGSLFSIFLVEYVSTSYVDHLYSSEDSDADGDHGHGGHTHSHSFPSDFYSTTPAPPPAKPTPAPSAATPLLAGAPVAYGSSDVAPARPGAPAHAPASSYFGGHHRHEPRALHSAHRRALPRASSSLWAISDGVSPAVRARDFAERERVDEECGGDGAGDADGDGDVERHAEHEEVNDEVAERGGVSEREEALSRKRQVIQILVLQLGIMVHSFVIGLTLSVTAGADFTSLLVAVCFHQLFEGLSLGIRIAGLPVASHAHGTKPAHAGHPLLRPILALLFAVTVPAGIAIGLLTLRLNRLITGPQLRLVQGTMAALSAGLLVYAGCVEMLAADFVLAAGPDTLATARPARRALALGSLLAGAAGMAVLGFWQ